MPDLVPIARALVSVSDKAELIPFARELAALGVEIISTGGTASALRAAGVAVTPIDSVTGFPEVLGGRVKTLHPKVHGGLLGVRDDAEHRKQMAAHAIAPIDLVCVNLYPFEATIAKPGCTREEAIEQIDIGGPGMIRSGAKNHAWVTCVTSPSQYPRVLAELHAHGGKTTRALREALAAEAFALTARYDAAIAAHLHPAPETRFPPLLTLQLVKRDDLRYGENPHQHAAFYSLRSADTSHAPAASLAPTLASAEQLHGKELSYNNLSDAAAALELALALARVDPARVGACVVKHTNPCGSALAPSPAEAVDCAIAGDPIAAYGGILALSARVDDDAAKRICDKDCFFEVIIAPAYHPEALERIRARWANVRILAAGGQAGSAHPQVEFRSIPGGVLVQDRDLALTPPTRMEHRAGPKPTPDVLASAGFLEATGRFLFSNAVALGGSAPEHAGSLRLFGAGAGQMDRLTSCALAVEKAGRHAKGAVAYSDAFFPFPDGPEVLIRAGVRAIVHPGGSKRDADTFAACDKAGVTCLTTGVRHFRH